MHCRCFFFITIATLLVAASCRRRSRTTARRASPVFFAVFAAVSRFRVCVAECCLESAGRGRPRAAQAGFKWRPPSSVQVSVFPSGLVQPDAPEDCHQMRLPPCRAQSRDAAGLHDSASMSDTFHLLHFVFRLAAVVAVVVRVASSHRSRTRRSRTTATSRSDAAVGAHDWLRLPLSLRCNPSQVRPSAWPIYPPASIEATFACGGTNRRGGYEGFTGFRYLRWGVGRDDLTHTHCLTSIVKP